jgi:hypothetical protein
MRKFLIGSRLSVGLTFALGANAAPLGAATFSDIGATSVKYDVSTGLAGSTTVGASAVSATVIATPIGTGTDTAMIVGAGGAALIAIATGIVDVTVIEQSGSPVIGEPLRALVVCMQRALSFEICGHRA